MTFREVQKWLEIQFFHGFPSSESTYFSRYLVEKVSGFPAHSWWGEHTEKKLHPSKIEEVSRLAQRVASGEPIQYVLEEAWFLGRKFTVTPSVLIPRPETEELCTYIIGTESPFRRGKVLEIGTGSGCIAISLGFAFPQSKILAIDISKAALSVASENAKRLGVTIDFIEQDLFKGLASEIYDVDLLVSNPPYIPPENMSEMHRNVVAYEPHIALFTPSGDPLLFYRKIAKEGLRVLTKGGKIWFEVHEDYAEQVSELLLALGYSDIKILQDFRGCNRFVSANTHFLG